MAAAVSRSAVVAGQPARGVIAGREGHGGLARDVRGKIEMDGPARLLERELGGMGDPVAADSAVTVTLPFTMGARSAAWSKA